MFNEIKLLLGGILHHAAVFVLESMKNKRGWF